MDKFARKPAAIALSERHGFRVVDDLAGMPVSERELDAVEAFLMAAFKAVMAGEMPPMADLAGICDSERPQTHAEVKKTAQGRERRR
ncbi:hypothetical protein [Mesorhizobium sp. L-2-11]|uniref:hypothetical protein n=1 Tax=Mesorhizobium sp. L-2-11 TaxID=2744521 RepID=UPI001929130A|nr:hypothetical protein [Mesorhizobium sp. L-2-11]BCH14980.1 hypothetical protein MesoLjLa_18310 [Mesorhizobium sp. L-2-11]